MINFKRGKIRFRWLEGLKRTLEKVEACYVRWSMYYWKRKAIRGHLWLRDWRKLERTVGSAHYECHKQQEHFLSLEKAEQLLLNQIRNTSDSNQVKELLILAEERTAQADHAYKKLLPLYKKRSKIKIKVSLKDARTRRVYKRD